MKEAIALKEASDCKPIPKVNFLKNQPMPKVIFVTVSTKILVIIIFLQILKLPLPSNNSVTQVENQCVATLKFQT